MLCRKNQDQPNLWKSSCLRSFSRLEFSDCCSAGRDVGVGLFVVGSAVAEAVQDMSKESNGADDYSAQDISNQCSSFKASLPANSQKLAGGGTEEHCNGSFKFLSLHLGVALEGPSPGIRKPPAWH